jgi:hypothetical protein
MSMVEIRNLLVGRGSSWIQGKTRGTVRRSALIEQDPSLGSAGDHWKNAKRLKHASVIGAGAHRAEQTPEPQRRRYVFRLEANGNKRLAATNKNLT